MLFADDSNLLSSGNNLKELQIRKNQELKTACDWFKINKLCLNVSKAITMVLCAKNKQYDKNNLNLSLIISFNRSWKNKIAWSNSR